MNFQIPKTTMSKETKFTVAKTEQNNDEMYFGWYLDELMAHGYIKRFYREPETIIVMPAYVHKREKHFKTKPNEHEDISLFQTITYTYDFRIIWEEKAKYLFTEVFEKGGSFKFGIPTFISHYVKIAGEVELVSYIDVKPHMSAAQFGGGKLASFYTFPFIQKILLNTRGLYINKIIPRNQGKFGLRTCLFATTFTPNRYKFTDINAKQRNIKFRVVPITSYIKTQQSIIDDALAIEAKKNLTSNQQSLL